MATEFSDNKILKPRVLTNYKRLYLFGLVSVNVSVSDRLPNVEYGGRKYKQEINVNIFGKEVFAFSITCDRKGIIMMGDDELKDGSIIRRLPTKE